LDCVVLTGELAAVSWTTAVVMGVLRWRDRPSADHAPSSGARECSKLQEAQVRRTSWHEPCLRGGVW